MKLCHFISVFPQLILIQFGSIILFVYIFESYEITKLHEVKRNGINGIMVDLHLSGC